MIISKNAPLFSKFILICSSKGYPYSFFLANMTHLHCGYQQKFRYNLSLQIMPGKSSDASHTELHAACYWIAMGVPSNIIWTHWQPTKFYTTAYQILWYCPRNYVLILRFYDSFQCILLALFFFAARATERNYGMPSIRGPGMYRTNDDMVIIFPYVC